MMKPFELSDHLTEFSLARMLGEYMRRFGIRRLVIEEQDGQSRIHYEHVYRPSDDNFVSSGD